VNFTEKLGMKGNTCFVAKSRIGKKLKCNKNIHCKWNPCLELNEPELV
jgi:hypothetical protein